MSDRPPQPPAAETTRAGAQSADSGEGAAATAAAKGPSPRRSSLASYGPAVIFLLAALVYGGFRSNHHYFDSIHYARIAETGENLYWQKHILQHALVRWIWLAHGKVSAGATALTVAQWVNVLAAAGTVTLLFVGLRRYCRASLAAAAALLFGLCGVMARMAVEGEVHILPLLLLALLVYLLCHQPRDGAGSVWIGLTLAGAILMHQSYVVFVPAVLAHQVVRRVPWRAVGLTLAVATVGCVITYGVVFALSGLDWAQLPRWLLHEAGIAGFNSRSVKRAAEAFLNALSPSGNRYPVLRFDSIVAGLALVALVVQGVRKRTARTTPLLLSCGLIVVGGVAAITWHHPTFQYFCPILLAIVVVAALGLASLPRRIGALAAWGLVTLYAAFSFVHVLRPVHDSTTNDALNRARFVAEHATRADLVLSTGTGAATHDLHYIPYFANTRTVTLWQAQTLHGADRMWPGLMAIIDEAPVAGRLLVFGEMVAPGTTFVGFRKQELPMTSDDVRALLARDYDLVEVALYRGADYTELLLELRPRPRAGPAEGRPCGRGCPIRFQCVGGFCRCGPQPHFQLREGRCLPSCGVMANNQAVAPEASACCDLPCMEDATFASKKGETWDCAYCCGGEANKKLCSDPPP